MNLSPLAESSLSRQRVQVSALFYPIECNYDRDNGGNCQLAPSLLPTLAAEPIFTDAEPSEGESLARCGQVQASPEDIRDGDHQGGRLAHAFARKN